MILSDALSRISLVENEDRSTSSKKVDLAGQESFGQKLNSAVTSADARSVAQQYPEMTEVAPSHPLPSKNRTEIDAIPEEGRTIDFATDGTSQDPIVANLESPVTVQQQPVNDTRPHRTGSKPTRRSSRRRRKNASSKGGASDDGISTEGSGGGKSRQTDTVKPRCAPSSNSRPDSPGFRHGLSSSRWAVRAGDGPASRNAFLANGARGRAKQEHQPHPIQSSSKDSSTQPASLAHQSISTRTLDFSDPGIDVSQSHSSAGGTPDDRVDSTYEKGHAIAEQVTIGSAPVSRAIELVDHQKVADGSTSDFHSRTARMETLQRIDDRGIVGHSSHYHESRTTHPAIQLRDKLRSDPDSPTFRDNVTPGQNVPHPTHFPQQQQYLEQQPSQPFGLHHFSRMNRVKSNHHMRRGDDLYAADALCHNGVPFNQDHSLGPVRRASLDMLTPSNGADFSPSTQSFPTSDPLMMFWQRVHNSWGVPPAQQNFPPPSFDNNAPHETRGSYIRPSYSRSQIPLATRISPVPHTIERTHQPAVEMQDGWLIPPQYAPGPRARTLRHAPSQIIHRQAVTQVHTRNGGQIRRAASIPALPYLQQSPTGFVTPKRDLAQEMTPDVLSVPYDSRLRIPLSASSEAGFHNNPLPPQVMSISGTTFDGRNDVSAYKPQGQSERPVGYAQVSPAPSEFPDERVDPDDTSREDTWTTAQNTNKTVTTSILVSDDPSDSPRSAFSSKRPSRSTFDSRPIVRTKPEEVLSWRTARNVSAPILNTRRGQKYVPPPVAHAKGIPAKGTVNRPDRVGRTSLGDGLPRVNTPPPSSTAVTPEEAAATPQENGKENAPRRSKSTNQTQ
ncbi:hypothetical protein VNI00_001152 [Paramarasmius palmivorus]|uniref:Uncharacterized protein n=1 Tax=Paramarasmius palmivorus TaxID=297713 RepID=A0AAW0E6N1_9AGAR